MSPIGSGFYLASGTPGTAEQMAYRAADLKHASQLHFGIAANALARRDGGKQVALYVVIVPCTNTFHRSLIVRIRKPL